MRLFLFRVEYRLDRTFKETCNSECEREARIVLPRLQRIHCLTGYLEALRQISLRPIALCAEHLETIPQR
jgi:hypothetical protein